MWFCNEDSMTETGGAAGLNQGHRLFTDDSKQYLSIKLWAAPHMATGITEDS